MQTLRLLDGDDVSAVRRPTLGPDKPTTNGETEIQLLTNLPAGDAADARAEKPYLGRRTIENAFQEVEQSLCGEINLLGYSVSGFTTAVITDTFL